MNYGFIKTAASSLKLKVADVSFNTSIIKEAIDSALEKNVKLLVTPELSVKGQGYSSSCRRTRAFL